MEETVTFGGNPDHVTLIELGLGWLSWGPEICIAKYFTWEDVL